MNNSDRELIITSLSHAERRKALDRFEDLLNRKTTEHDWQTFFDEYPQILVEGLSLQSSRLFHQVPLQSGIPDYVFHRRIGDSNTSDIGIIELKRPDQPIVASYSTKHIIPSSHVVTAELEASRHLEAIDRGKFLNANDFVVAGNRRYAFIIIGLSADITKKCHTELLKKQFRNLLPLGFHLYTYDELFQLLASSTPPLIQVLFVSVFSESSKRVANTVIKNKFGMHARPCMGLCELANRFASEITISKGSLKVDAKSIMGLMRLAAAKGTELAITTDGTDAEAAIQAIIQLIESGFRSVYERIEYSQYHDAIRNKQIVVNVRSMNVQPGSTEERETKAFIAHMLWQGGFENDGDNNWELAERLLKNTEFANIVKTCTISDHDQIHAVRKLAYLLYELSLNLPVSSTIPEVNWRVSEYMLSNLMEITSTDLAKMKTLAEKETLKSIGIERG